MEAYLLGCLKKDDLSLDDISNYGIARSAGGIYTLTLWKNGKTEKGSRRSISIKLDGKMKNMFLAVETLEELMKENYDSISFIDRISEEQPDNPFL